MEPQRVKKLEVFFGFDKSGKWMSPNILLQKFRESFLFEVNRCIYRSFGENIR
ncbi:MAG: hypothetical protein GYA51_06615 [Candidatus Methanofastidiosa archaeon]|nr:hypothetical protein [Candidatus Methanofastidiosa archaeon]